MDELTLLESAWRATPDNRDLARLYAAKLAEAGRWLQVCDVLDTPTKVVCTMIYAAGWRKNRLRSGRSGLG